MTIYQDAIQLIGSTPLLRLGRLRRGIQHIRQV